MKLFKSLLVAPATLGLLAPLSATANEVNLNDISNYSKDNIQLKSNEFDFVSSQESLLISGGEGLVETSEDSFSSTTSASFGSTFYVGSVDAGTDEGATTFSYDFALDLSTSFTGEDSLDIAIIGGNANETTVDDYMGGDGTGDVLTLDGVAYTFPVGGVTVTAGDGVGVDDLNAGACAYSAFTDLLSDCGTGNVGGQADSAIAASYDFGNGFTIAGGIGGGGSAAAVNNYTATTTATIDITAEQIAALVDGNGIATAADDIAPATATFTTTVVDADATAADPFGLLSDQDPSTIGLELAYNTDTYGVSVAYTDDDAGGIENTYYSIQAAWTPDAPYSVSFGSEYNEDDESTYFLGLTTDVGPGSLSVGMATQAMLSDHEDNLQYEVAYSYDVNDGMTITPGAFIAENAGDVDDEFGLVVTTSFSF